MAVRESRPRQPPTPSPQTTHAQPSEGETIYDFALADCGTAWQPWRERVPVWTPPATPPSARPRFADLMVATVESARLGALLELMHSVGQARMATFVWVCDFGRAAGACPLSVVLWPHTFSPTLSTIPSHAAHPACGRPRNGQDRHCQAVPGEPAPRRGHGQDSHLFVAHHARHLSESR